LPVERLVVILPILPWRAGVYASASARLEAEAFFSPQKKLWITFFSIAHLAAIC
jgi:hypothetical protein